MLVVEWFIIGVLVGFFFAALGMVAKEVIFGDPTVNAQVEQIRQARLQMHRAKYRYLVAKFFRRNPSALVTVALERALRDSIEMKEREDEA
jgi:hypothetical protein